MRLTFGPLLALTALPAVADGILLAEDVAIVYYEVTGQSLPELAQQLDLKGPRGYWAWTDAGWRWDLNCNVRFTATIRLPSLGANSALSESEKAEWDRMFAALLAHEMEHVEIGRNTARAIKAAGCRGNTMIYNRRARAADQALDARTNHGVTTGATLNY